MFYEQLIKICDKNGVKPTPILKKLGLSTGNLTKWAQGASVNSDILIKLSKHFNVPVDYFFEEEEGVSCYSDLFLNIDSPDFSIQNMFNIFKAHPDHIASMTAIFSICREDLERIAKYMGCDLNCLINTGVIVDEKRNNLSNASVKDIIFVILNAIPGNREISNLQVYLSTVIIANLLKLGIGKKDLIDAGLVVKKIEKLYNVSSDSKTKTPLNFSDLMILNIKLGINFDSMLTGNKINISEN